MFPNGASSLAESVSSLTLGRFPELGRADECHPTAFAIDLLGTSDSGAGGSESPGFLGAQ